MRKPLFLCLVFISISMFSQTLLEKVAISSQMYGSLDPNQLKLTILDAINLTNEKDVIAAYLTKIEKDFVWIVVTFRYEYVVSVTEPKIISKKPLETAVFTYSVGLRDAISLTVMSIGKNILFALYQPEGWLVGNDKNLAVVSMKTPAILRIDQSPTLFRQVQQEILRKQQGGGGAK
ncbi:hypothetical protein [Pseudothermotoga sp.]|nr:hypothetical protein [Pseudothermotoga sp.]MCX7813784.1 hypothetical protein [Pseudothermotoga sp.]MDW8140602.1 hypothetical protein [Pseudothermotoga sp.]